MNKKTLVSLTAVAILAVVGYKFLYKKPAPVELPKYSAYLSCDGKATDYNVSFQSTAYYLKNALPADEKEKQILFNESILFQNLYPFTNLSEMYPGILKSTNLGSKAEVKILSVEDAEYPHDVVVEPEQEIFFFHPVKQNYLSKVLPLGKISEGEPAVKVTYEYKNILQYCLTSDSPELLKQIEYRQPKDPFFAYFSVKPEQRRDLENNAWKTKARINPCMNPHGIGDSKVAPFALWYHWQPNAKGKDLNGDSFDCKTLYTDKNTNKLSINFTDRNPNEVKFIDFAAFENLNRPIRMSMIFGAYNFLDFQEFDEADVTNYVNKYVSGISITEATKSLPINQKKYDSNFSSLLILLWNTTNHMQIHSMESEIEKYHLTIYLRGKLKLSKKDIEIKYSISRNKAGNEGADFFNKTFANSVLNDDIVIYGGHASYGAMLSEGLNIARNEKEKADPNLKYQVVALFSCSSNYYFPAESFPKNSPEMKRDMITSGGGYNDPTNQSTLALIGSMDSYLYNQSHVPFGLWSKTFKSDNFLILSNN